MSAPRDPDRESEADDAPPASSPAPWLRPSLLVVAAAVALLGLFWRCG